MTAEIERTLKSEASRGRDTSLRTEDRGGNERIKRVVRGAILLIPVALLMIWTILPVLVTISTSLKTPAEVLTNPSLIPEAATFEAYEVVLSRPGVRGAFVNSTIVGFGTTLLTLLIAVPAAYAFARFRFRGRHFLLFLTLLPRLAPSLGLMVPLYRLAVYAGLLDKRMTLIVVYSGLLMPLAVWLLVGFFQQVPREIEEAAMVDGSSLSARLRYIVLPLAIPALITIGVLAFREAWNEFTLALVLTTTPGNRTLPYELYLMQAPSGIPDYPAEAAFALLTILPFVLVYSQIERYVVQGLSTGSGK